MACLCGCFGLDVGLDGLYGLCYLLCLCGWCVVVGFVSRFLVYYSGLPLGSFLLLGYFVD